MRSFMDRYKDLFGENVTMNHTVVTYQEVEGVLYLDGKRIRSLYYEDSHLRMLEGLELKPKNQKTSK